MPLLTVDNLMHDKILHKPSKIVKNFQDPEIIMLLQDMHKIASSPGAAGVAAPQLGALFQIFALHTNKELPVLFFFNPKIISTSEETYEVEEGCLSVPGKICKVTRFKTVTLTWQDELGRKSDPKGRKYQHTFEGFTAQAVQHEVGHIHGTLISDISEEIFDTAKFQKAFDEAKSNEK